MLEPRPAHDAVLGSVDVEVEWGEGAVTETHVDQEASSTQVHDEGEVIEVRSEFAVVVDPSRVKGDVVAERAEQPGERSIEFEAPAATSVIDDL